MFSEPIGKTRWPHLPLIGWDIFDFSSETAERNSTKLDRKQDLNALYQVFVFGPIGKTRWPPWPPICSDIFNFFSETAERNSTKLDRKQDLNVFYQVCVIGTDRKNKMATLAADLLRHFRLLLWNGWTEFNKTWQEARSQRLLPSLCYWDRSQKQDGHPGRWFAETFSTSSLKSLNGIQRNLTGSKLLTSSTTFVFFGLIWKTRLPPWPLIDWGIFYFSDEATERDSKKLDRKQDLKVLYQVCVFGLIGKTRWPPKVLIGWDIFDFFSETAEQNSTKLDRKEDLNVLYQVCVFRSDRKNKMAALASDWLRHFRLLLWNRWIWIQRNLTGSKISTSSSKFVFFWLIGKTRWPPQPLIGWDIFDFFSETAEQNSTKLDRKEDLNVLYQVCVFRADREKKMAAMAHDWLRHFWLLLWNCWTGFKEIWQEARSQHLLPSCVFQSIKITVLADLSQRWQIVLRCTICGPLGPLFMYLFRWRKGGGVALMHVYVSEHKVSPYYRTAWRMFMKLGRDVVLMAPHMHLGVLARST